MITALNHITLAVSNIDRSFDFYHNILGFKPLVKWDKGAYFLIADGDNAEFWFCLNLDLNHTPSACYTHYAFTVAEKDFTSMKKRILEYGAKIFKDNSSPGKSLYFLDPDGHKLEIHLGSWHERVKVKKEDPGTWENIEWFI